jgi:ParB family chromosome partitioning protein
MAAKNVLGRGVGALLPDEAESDAERFFLCDIDKIRPNPHQPRSYFDPEKLGELAESIRDRGVIQPLLVTRAKGNRYHLIAGERRLRAARLAELDEVPVVVMEAGSADEQLELALIENIQRHDLNAIEEATAYARLIEEFSLTQEDVARRVGKKRSTITNVLRLLKLPPTIQEDVVQQRLSEGHARVLLRLQDDESFMLEMRERILAEKLSVRQTENLCRGGRKKDAPKAGKGKPRQRKETGELPASYCKALTNQVTNALNTKVRIVQNGERGRLEIEYYSSDDLERLVSLLTSALETA